MPTISLDELFRRTLEGDYEDDAPYTAVHDLRRLGSRDVFEVASQWCHSPDPLRRARGLDVIAQLGKTADHPKNSFPAESFALVSELIASEKELRPLSSAIAALGHLDDERGVRIISPLRHHPSSEIRFSVTCALGSYPSDPISVEALLELVNDEDEEVRDWATFALGVLGDTDSEQVRAALIKALDDECWEVREEALVGVAKRHDLRALHPLLLALEQQSVTDRIVEAACFLLGFETEQEAWKATDYANALRAKFTQHPTGGSS